MPNAFLGTSHFDREQFAEIILENMLPERVPTEDEPVALLSRRGLVEELEVTGVGEVEGVFSQDGTLGGDLFTTVLGTLYRETTSLGAMGVTRVPSFAGGDDQIVATTGARLKHYNGTTFSTPTFPDSANVVAVGYLDGRFLAVRENSDRVYYSAIGDGTSWDGADFIEAESEPDALRDIRILNGTAALLGSQTIEFFATTANASLPYQRIQLRSYGQGLLNVNACDVVSIGARDSLAFVSADFGVYLDTEKVSPPWLDRKIEDVAGAEILLFGFVLDGHHCFAVSLVTETFVFDTQTGAWADFGSSGNKWGAIGSAVHNGLTVFAAAGIAKVVKFGGETENTDSALDGNTEFTRTATAIIRSDYPFPIDDITAEMAVGQTTSSTPPTCDMRLSRDQGETWTSWRSASFGATGKYRTRATIRRWGMIDAPGAVIQWRYTGNDAAVRPRLSAIKYNTLAASRDRG
ncbi:packaged DNA stabilization protein [Parasphingopyxis sp.]|uniref:packaged DNA stabilization protein n=1 Tax=Parasphingopyxis sp. TaxID=1920299 RepID=UPI0026160414|nr:packaged DNA stabilization protein [Parasphingopyxis sp.]